MSDARKDAALNRRLLHGHHGRRFISNENARWGELIEPGPTELPARPPQGMRVVLIASMQIGYLLLETVKAYQRHAPGRINLVGVVTDDAVNVDARIGVHKRLWKYYGPKQRQRVEKATIESALTVGAPVYTGEVKCDWFRTQLADWRPEVVLMCGFGQRLDEGLIDTPHHGLYNFHPSDLAAGHGAGLAPFDDLYARAASSSAWTVHRATEVIDAGPVLGTSPPISVVDAQGELPEQVQLIYNKMIDGVAPLVVNTLDALLTLHAGGGERWLRPADLSNAFPPGICEALAQPITDQHLNPPLPHPAAELFQ